VVAYTCLESAEYRDKNTKKYMSDSNVWEFATKVEDPTSLTRVSFTFADNVEILPVFKQRIQVYWRPSKRDDSVWSFDVETINQQLL